MNKRKRKYIILSVIIVGEFLIVRILNALGIIITSDLLKAIGSVIFYSPIVTLLIYLSDDPCTKKHWKIILRILTVYIALAFVVGVILSLLATV